MFKEMRIPFLFVVNCCALVIWAGTTDAAVRPLKTASAVPGIYPRVLADVNGDGKADVVGFSNSGVIVTVANNSGFGAPHMWSTAFGQNTGWTDNDAFPRILADVNGDGKADIVGFGNSGVLVALSTGTGFASPSYWSTAFGRDASGGSWTQNSVYPRLLADVNGDGKADVVGYGNDGVYVALSTGTSFQKASLWLSGFGFSKGWINNDIFPRTLADINGDGKADIVAFGNGVIAAPSTGTGFERPRRWIMSFGRNSKSGGWYNNTLFPRFLADVNGDGKADVVGFGRDGTYAALSTGTGLGSINRWSTQFSLKAGWKNTDMHPRTMADVNGDGLADIVGFGDKGVLVALSTKTSFETPVFWSSEFGQNTSAGGWTQNSIYPRFLADVNADGKTDVVGFGHAGIHVSKSTGAGLDASALWSPALRGTNWGCGQLWAGGSLTPGQSIISCSNAYRIAFQKDGNVVLYEGTTPVWSTKTGGKPAAKLIMQLDGNLVLYGADNTVYWASSLHGGKLTRKPATLYLLDDRNLSIVENDDAAKVLWTSQTVKLNPANLGNSINAADWLIKDVCVDSANNPIPFDAYYECPAGTKRRKIQLGDPLPYNNYNQFKYQINDSFHLLDRYGNPLLVHNFDYLPFGIYNRYNGSDGFDVHAIIDGKVTYSNTQDGGGFSTTFFGANCTLGGWFLFPTNGFLSGGQTFAPIFGVYWEQNAQAFPGACPAGYAWTLEAWELRPSMAFGGIKGNPVKTMNTMVAIHGYETDNGVTPTANFLARGHLEVFYYTQQYGLTRWEVWTPASRPMTTSNKSQCNGPATVNYRGMDFNVQFCHDWSNVQLAATPAIPLWPLPNANLLSNWHFDSASDFSDDHLSIGSGKWHRAGNSPAGNLIQRWQHLSTSAVDAAYGKGVMSLGVNCGPGSDGKCGAPGTQFIYQDIPITSFCNGCTYLYGANVRTGGGTGTIHLAIQVVSGSGQVLWQDVTGANVDWDNGDGRSGEAESMYRAAKFVHKAVKLPIYPGAAYIRFLILPETAHTFYITDVWLNRFPEMTQTLGKTP